MGCCYAAAATGELRRSSRIRAAFATLRESLVLALRSRLSRLRIVFVPRLGTSRLNACHSLRGTKSATRNFCFVSSLTHLFEGL
uniref:Uncharacterized protein n=1 Tax=Trichogramma kaykai TaxID=54128 RepID=A0ABD2X358_9HYME